MLRFVTLLFALTLSPGLVADNHVEHMVSKDSAALNLPFSDAVHHLHVRATGGEHK